MYGVKYVYHDQYEHEDRLFPIVFTSSELAEEWVEGHLAAPYLVVVPLEVNPSIGDGE